MIKDGERIRIVQDEAFNKETADIIISFGEPFSSNVHQIGENEYAYGAYTKTEKQANGGYKCNVIKPSSESYSVHIPIPAIYPKKVIVFTGANNGRTLIVSYSFIGIDGKEFGVYKNYNPFVISQYSKSVDAYSNEIDASKGTSSSLDFFLEEHNFNSPSPVTEVQWKKRDVAMRSASIKSYLFTAFLNQYNLIKLDFFEDSIIINSPETYGFTLDEVLESFADDDFYAAVVNEERRRWVEIVAPMKRKNPNLDPHSLEETKTYIAKKKIIAKIRGDALKSFNSGV